MNAKRRCLAFDIGTENFILTSGMWWLRVGDRPRPHTCEQNYAIWRGLGTPMRNYMAMRFIRENYHRRDLLPGSIFEFINDWWPIQWSHHYVASGDTCASFHSACAAGDADGYWPAFQTVAESAYAHHGTMWQGTGSNTMELEPLFLAAVVDGLFGVKPWFGESLLVLRPSPLTGWDDLEFNHVDVRYRFHRDAVGGPGGGHAGGAAGPCGVAGLWRHAGGIAQRPVGQVQCGEGGRRGPHCRRGPGGQTAPFHDPVARGHTPCRSAGLSATADRSSIRRATCH